MSKQEALLGLAVVVIAIFALLSGMVIGFRISFVARAVPVIRVTQAGAANVWQIVLATEDLADETANRDRPIAAGEEAVVLQELSRDVIRVRFLRDDYVWEFNRAWFNPTDRLYIETLSRDDDFAAGKIVYVSPGLADELTRGERGRLTKTWEPVQIVEEYDKTVFVRFSDGYEGRFGKGWFYPYTPTW